MTQRLGGKVAIVTGAANGIGEATVRRFAAEGARVIVTDIAEDAGRALAEALPEARFIRVDVTRESDVAAAVDFAVSEFGQLDIMVNNAGLIGAVGSIAEISAERWRTTLAILLDGAFYGMKHAARVMKPRREGRILSTGSIASIDGGVGAHAYTAAKHGLIGLIKSAATELSLSGITVNGVAPGSTVTPLAMNFLGSEAAATAFSAKESPLGRAISANDIAEAFLYLAAESGRNVTGQLLVVDGGYTAIGSGGGRQFHGAPAGFAGAQPD